MFLVEEGDEAIQRVAISALRVCLGRAGAVVAMVSQCDTGIRRQETGLHTWQ